LGEDLDHTGLELVAGSMLDVEPQLPRNASELLRLYLRLLDSCSIGQSPGADRA
jgi:hypothetical protein